MSPTRPFARTRALAPWLVLLTLPGLLGWLHAVTPAWTLLSTPMLRNTLHAPLFAGLTLALLGVLRWRWTRGAYLGAGLAAMAAGLLGESLQGIGFGEPSASDLLQDGLGIVVGLTLFAAFDRSVWIDAGRTRRWMLLGSGLLLAALAVAPMVVIVTALAVRDARFPSLLDGESHWQGELYDGPRPPGPVVLPAPEDWPLPGSVLRLKLDRPGVAGLNLHDPYPVWHGYQALTFVAASATGEPVSFRLRIRDFHHSSEPGDRFRRRFTVGPAPTRIRIPLAEIASGPDDRSLDLGAVDSLIIDQPELRAGDHVYLDDLRLE